MLNQLYRVPDWAGNFESAKSKTYKHKSQTYMPNKHGLGYLQILQKPDGAALFGAWCAMVQVLSRQPERQGYLTDTTLPDGMPLTPAHLSLLTHIPEATIAEMLAVCASLPIAWLEVIEPGIAEGYRGDTTGANQSPYPLPLPLPKPLPKPVPEKDSQPAKGRFGEFHNIRLTPDEYARLEKKNGAALALAITILDDYIESKGTKYKSHYATLKAGSWVWERVADVQRKTGGGSHKPWKGKE